CRWIISSSRFLIKSHVGSSAEFTCKVTGGSDSTYIHWYRAPTGGALQRLLYLSYSKPDPSWEAGFSSKKLTAHFQDRSICKLLVHKLENADTGHYYCATWDYTQCSKPPGALHKKTQQQQNHTYHSLGAGLRFHVTGAAELSEHHPQPTL
uniref:Ig-like domain-containing protein n=1 Tax=Gopherus evgoodei TaxID=1825980 RepID=A0A8C4W071_9SAUR